MSATAALQITKPTERSGPKPMPLWQALLYFGIPAAGIRLSLYNGMPALVRLGLSRFEAFCVSLTVPLAILFACALGFAQSEGSLSTWGAFRARLRLQRMNGRDWLWTAGGFLVTLVGTGLVGSASILLIRACPVLAPPEFLPAFLKPAVTSNPAALSAVLAESVGAPLAGNWGIVVLSLIMLFFNVAGEELWWRGLILPRQEQVHGRWTWLIHGLLWLLFHLPFYPWRIDLLPYCLTIALIAQRRRNTWPGVIIHLQNGMFQLVLLAAVCGLI